MTITLEQLARHLGAELHGDANVVIQRIANLETAQAGEISFLSDSKYQKHLSATQASAVLIREADLAACQTNALVLKDPYVGFARVAQLLDTTPAPASSIHSTAVIADDVVLGNQSPLVRMLLLSLGLSWVMV